MLVLLKTTLPTSESRFLLQLIGLVSILGPISASVDTTTILSTTTTSSSINLSTKPLANEAPFNQKRRSDLRWPNRQVNVLIDSKSLNKSEIQVLESIFDQIQLKTCLIIKKLKPKTVDNHNFDHNRVFHANFPTNFIYIFKPQFHNWPPSLGLSSFGCVGQGKQSLVLTNLAFRWPHLVLKYHIMRSIGVDNLERPDRVIKQLLVDAVALPLAQKISSSRPAQVNLSTSYTIDGRIIGVQRFAPELPVSNDNQPQASYLSERDLDQIKHLYNCTDFKNRLSMVGSNLVATNHSNSPSNYYYTMEPTDKLEKKLADEHAFESESGPYLAHKTDPNSGRLVEQTAKRIVENLLSTFEPNSGTTNEQESHVSSSPKHQTQQSSNPFSELSGSCKPLESCPITEANLKPQTASDQNDHLRRVSRERPMVLKLDRFHAQDVHLQQANQMKLSRVSNENNLASYRLMAPSTDWPMNQPQPQQQQSSIQAPGRSEMLISFEQANNKGTSGNQSPVTSFSSPQVLKLCSCTCQTMVPAVTQPPVPITIPTPPPFTYPPFTPFPTIYPTQLPTIYPTEYPPTNLPPFTYPTAPPFTLPPWTFPDPFNYTTTTTTTTTTTSTTDDWDTTDHTDEPTTTHTTSTEPETTRPTTTTTTTTTSRPPTETTPAPLASNACDLVQWVRPNKTVYASARIVWDVDRANQNYFICQNKLDDEMVPGKTHGFSCKISSEGKSFEMHNFSVLTKPEQVNLAWVKHTSDSFGKTNFPVVGGYSKQRDPYVVSRCLVRDENNDVIALIGYVNNKGVGWFPFDDIQIECAQYDVLACIN